MLNEVRAHIDVFLGPSKRSWSGLVHKYMEIVAEAFMLFAILRFAYETLASMGKSIATTFNPPFSTKQVINPWEHLVLRQSYKVYQLTKKTAELPDLKPPKLSFDLLTMKVDWSRVLAPYREYILFTVKYWSLFAGVYVVKKLISEPTDESEDSTDGDSSG
jgi:hypothetical protein